MSTERLFWDMLSASGKSQVHSLPDHFKAVGAEGETYLYSQKVKTNFAFMYEVMDTDTREIHYEVFKRHVHDIDRREVYPWEQPVADEVFSSTNNAAAMQMCVAITKEGSEEYGKSIPMPLFFRW